LAKERHFGGAEAAALPSAMSTSLKQLETLGVMLVQPASRFQGFTPEGDARSTGAAHRRRHPRHRQEIMGEGQAPARSRIAAIRRCWHGGVADNAFRRRYPEVRFRVVSARRPTCGPVENLESMPG